MQQTSIEADKLVLDGRKRLSMTGVQSVDGFSDQVINLTVSGNKVRIIGDGLKITAYNKATGSLSADGNFTEIKYNGKKKNHKRMNAKRQEYLFIIPFFILKLSDKEQKIHGV